MIQAKEILIVDDEVGIRELLSEILQDEGYRVSVAENATTARAYRVRQQPALVLLDIWMPDTDGVTLLREWAAAGHQSAGPARRGARGDALLCRNRPVLQGGAEGARVPVAETRARRSRARVHERRAARQSRGRGQVRCRAACGARRGGSA